MTKLINSDHDLRVFCDEHRIHLGPNAHQWDYVIGAYDYLRERLNPTPSKKQKLMDEEEKEPVVAENNQVAFIIDKGTGGSRIFGFLKDKSSL